MAASAMADVCKQTNVNGNNYVPPPSVVQRRGTSWFAVVRSVCVCICVCPRLCEHAQSVLPTCLRGLGLGTYAFHLCIMSETG